MRSNKWQHTAQTLRFEVPIKQEILSSKLVAGDVSESVQDADGALKVAIMAIDPGNPVYRIGYADYPQEGLPWPRQRSNCD